MASYTDDLSGVSNSQGTLPGSYHLAAGSAELWIRAEGADESTTFVDSSFSARSITAQGGAAISTDWSFAGSGSAEFSAGAGDRLDVATSGFQLPSSWTISFRARMKARTNDAPCLFQHMGVTNGRLLYLFAGNNSASFDEPDRSATKYQFAMHIYGGEGYEVVNSIDDIAYGEDVHFALVQHYTGVSATSYTKFYINGNYQGQINGIFGINPYGANGNIYIGGTTAGCGAPLCWESSNAYIDEFAIFPSEIWDDEFIPPLFTTSYTFDLQGYSTGDGDLTTLERIFDMSGSSNTSGDDGEIHGWVFDATGESSEVGELERIFYLGGSSLLSDPKGLYQFEGNLQDSSGYGNHGTSSDDTYSGTLKKVGNFGLVLDPIGSGTANLPSPYIAVYGGSGAFTVAFWGIPPATTGAGLSYSILSASFYTNNTRFEVGHTGKAGDLTTLFIRDNVNGVLNATSDISLDEEHLVIVDYDGAAYHIWADNTLIGSFTVSSLAYGPTVNLQSGLWASRYWQTFDAMWFFDRALTDQERNLLWSGGEGLESLFDFGVSNTSGFMDIVYGIPIVGESNGTGGDIDLTLNFEGQSNTRGELHIIFTVRVLQGYSNSGGVTLEYSTGVDAGDEGYSNTSGFMDIVYGLLMAGASQSTGYDHLGRTIVFAGSSNTSGTMDVDEIESLADLACYVLNLDTNRTYQFSNFGFSGFGRFDDKFMGAKGTKIYDLETAATDDDGTAISAYMEIETDFAMPNRKGIRSLYQEEDTVTITVTDSSGNTVARNITPYEFKSLPRTTISRAWTIKVENVSGASVTLRRLHGKLDGISMKGV